MKSKFSIAAFTIVLAVSPVCHAQQVSVVALQREVQIAKTDTAKANAYNRLSIAYRNTNPDSTAFFARQAAALSELVGYRFGQAEAAVNLGNSEILGGNYTAALSQFSKAQKIFSGLLQQHSDDKAIRNGLARAFGSSGVVYTQQSNYYMALENYEKALKLYEANNDRSGTSKALNNIAVVYKSQLHYPNALEYFKKAYKIQAQLRDANAAVTLTNIGVIYFETRKPDAALAYYEKASRSFAEFPNPIGLALLDNYFGDYYTSQNNAQKAEAYYRQSLDLYEQMQNKFGASLALYNLAKLYTSQQKYADAMPLASRSLTYATAMGTLDQAYHSEKLVSELYGFLNNTAESFRHYKKYIVARDSIFNLENARKFAQAEMDSEYRKQKALLEEKDKRQRQFTAFSLIAALLLIVLVLVVYNRRQVKRRLTLQKEVAEYEQKALHLQMNPHFVFNCLGAISSFIVQNGTDSALKYLSKFSKLMRLTLEYSKGSLIPIDKEIESLQNYLELEQLRFHHKFQFRIESSARIEFNMGLPPLLIQPFVENAILHGMVPKEGNGLITVNFDVQHAQLVCTVTDDGIGLSESMLLKENSVTAHKSMALEITKKRLQIMESTTAKAAQIDIEELEEHNKKSGTRVTLRLPVQYIP